MKKYMKKTPEGLKDMLYEECAAKAEIERIITDLFTMRGYSRAITPTVEYYDLFDDDMLGIPQEQMYKLTSVSGRIMALRPDMTIPIARLVSTRLKDVPAPIRLYYTENIFKVNMNGSGHENEITQSGIELIGAKGLAADLEVLDMAVKVFEKCGISDYAIELGHAGFFGSLVRGLGVDDEKKEEIRRSIESKNYAELSLILSGIDDSPSAKVLKLLPSLYGGAEILDEAEKLCAGNGEAMEYLDYLRELYSKLSEISSDANINLDLGMVHRNNYYTGVVFRGYINGYGNTVISGGRYDGLMEKFGRPMPATGFAVDNNALISTLIASKGDKLMSKIDAVIYAERGYEAQAVMLAGNLADNGCISRICSSGGEEGAVSYAKELGAEKVYIVSNNIKTVDIEVSL
ncbi:MAG TPA: ATP phosphoribosyltransferase regulatory subunit [Firmicutes bacterium]|nr:ATP phosphoribosyltransferase regulatory subunit [Bacillota bacterium]